MADSGVEAGPDWAWNFQTTGVYITDRTAHRITGRTGKTLHTACGLNLGTGEGHQHTDDDDPPADEYQCGNCPWGDVQ